MPKTIIEQIEKNWTVIPLTKLEKKFIDIALRLFAEKIEKQVFHNLPDIATGGKEGYLVMGNKWHELKKQEGIE